MNAIFQQDSSDNQKFPQQSYSLNKRKQENTPVSLKDRPQFQYQKLPPSGIFQAGNMNNNNNNNKSINTSSGNINPNGPTSNRKTSLFSEPSHNINKTENQIKNQMNDSKQQQKQHNQQQQQQQSKNLDNMRSELEHVKEENKVANRKINYLQQLIDNCKTFESSRNLIDLKAFVKENYTTYSQLVDELYQEKFKSQELLAHYQEMQKQKEIFQSKNQQQQQQQEVISKSPRKNTEEKKEQSAEINANQQFYLIKIKELEERNQQLVKENQQIKHQNKQLNDQVSKKDFFKEYDKMVREVEGLRKQNTALAEKVRTLNANAKK